MAHLHPIIDDDNRLIVDPATRQIKNKSYGTFDPMTNQLITEDVSITLIQFDHNSERLTFECPRYVDGHDMSTCNDIMIHYTNHRGSVRGAYPVTDMAAEDDETVVFTWLISRNATKANGILNFVICFSCITDEGVIEYAWNTDVCAGISVKVGMNNGSAIVEEYIDTLAEWKRTLIDATKVQTVNGQAPDENGNVVVRGVDVTGATPGQLVLIKSVDENGVPTEWEAVDRTHYQKITETVLIEQQTLTTTAYSSDGVAFYELDPPPFTITEGQEYIVTWNGVQYVLIGAVDDHGRYGVYTYLGNPNKIDGSKDKYNDNGIPFCIAHDQTTGWNRIVLFVGDHRNYDTPVTFTVELVTKNTEVVKQLDEKFIPSTIARTSDIPEQVQADWNQNDETAADYVRNRTHGDIAGETYTLIDNMPNPISENFSETYKGNTVYRYDIGVYSVDFIDALPKFGKIKLTINGVSYEGGVKTFGSDSDYTIYAGNGRMWDTELEDTGESFLLVISSASNAALLDHTVLTTDEPVSITLPNGNTATGAVISIEFDTGYTLTLPEKFIPRTIARTSDLAPVILCVKQFSDNGGWLCYDAEYTKPVFRDDLYDLFISGKTIYINPKDYQGRYDSIKYIEFPEGKDYGMVLANVCECFTCEYKVVPS